MSDNLNQWMSRVDGGQSLTKLSIPGTHNSAACYMALPSVRCQDCSITEQLEHGVRFFDIRLGKMIVGSTTDELQVIHGKFPVKIPFPEKFSSVLNRIYNWLDENRSETAIVSIKQEGEDSWNGEEFPDFVWNNYVERNQDKWFLEDRMPNLDEVRGKVVLFRRFGTDRQNFGINASWWQYNTEDDDQGSFAVQDFCEINQESDINTKADYVKQFLNKAVQYNATESDRKLFVNFCSGANFFNPDCWPEKIAEKMNQEGIDSQVGRGCGILVVDYAGSNDWEIVKRVVDSNF